MQKQLEGARNILAGSADEVAISDGRSVYIVSNTHALPAR